MGSRRRARELVLQLLYKLEMAGDEFTPEIMGVFFDEFGGHDEDIDYAVILAENTKRHEKDIEEIIKAHLEHWTLDRLSSIDRNILRFATCELMYFRDVPVNVSINEAIEIAKKYSLEESATFINGVLDKIAKQAREGGP